jgi:hypothetical protein
MPGPGGLKQLPDEAVEDALRSGGILPGGTTEGAFNRLDKTVNSRGAAYGGYVDRLEGMGVKGADARDTIAELLGEAAKTSDNQMTEAAANVYRRAAARVSEKSPKILRGPDEPIYFGDVPDGPEFMPPEQSPVPGSLPLRKAEGLKRSAQKGANTAYRRLKNDEIGEAQIDVARILKEQNELAIERAGQAAAPGSELSLIADEFVPIKQSLGRATAARDAAMRGAAANAHKTSNSGAGLLHFLAEPKTATALLVKNIIKERAPSTYSSGAYWASRLAKAAASGAENNPGRVATGATAGLIGQRQGIEDETDGERFLRLLRGR